jgi:hypothetical protein
VFGEAPASEARGQRLLELQVHQRRGLLFGRNQQTDGNLQLHSLRKLLEDFPDLGLLGRCANLSPGKRTAEHFKQPLAAAMNVS